MKTISIKSWPSLILRVAHTERWIWRRLPALAMVILLSGLPAIAVAQDAFETTMREFLEARQRVEYVRDLTAWLQNGGQYPNRWYPNEMADGAKNVREQAAMAAEHLDKAKAALAAGEKNSAIGPETKKLLEYYLGNLGAELAARQKDFSKITVPKDDVNAAGPTAAPDSPPNAEAAAAKLAVMEKEIKAVAERAWALYEIGNATKTLQAAFEAAGVKEAVRYAPDWGNEIYLNVMNARGQLSQFAKPYAAEIARLKNGGALNPDYLAYLDREITRFETGSDRFFVLANDIVQHNVKCGRASDEGWFNSAIHDEGFLKTKALERLYKPIKAAMDGFSLAPPNDYDAFSKLAPGVAATLARPKLAMADPPVKGQPDPAKREVLKENEIEPIGKTGFEGFDMVTDAGRRAVALYKFRRTLHEMEEKLHKGETVSAKDLKELTESLKTLMGDRFPGLGRLMTVVAAKLKTVQQLQEYATAFDSLYAFTQGVENPVQAGQLLGDYLKAMKPFADKVPGMGPFLSAYATAVGSAMDTMGEIERTNRANLRAAIAAANGTEPAAPDREPLPPEIESDYHEIVEQEAQETLPPGPVLTLPNQRALREILAPIADDLQRAKANRDANFLNVVAIGQQTSEMEASHPKDPGLARQQHLYEVARDDYQKSRQRVEAVQSELHHEADRNTERLFAEQAMDEAKRKQR